MESETERYADPERVQQVLAHPLAEDDARRVAELFKALADPTRVRLLHALSHSELTVGDLARVVEMDDSISAISHHLRLLRNLRIVRDRREGKQIYYALDDDHIASILGQSLEHAGHT
ncbi:MAG: metalloregulator ArsR/SmtB family transcription factor [Chloroflexaceae bacterium]|jgi:DNA-binding transcriptional ArsR family regulator|nr:metalloregulator ArsR/SmtB family transcription factor [Chloroflexaceae bacterium]